MLRKLKNLKNIIDTDRYVVKYINLKEPKIFTREVKDKVTDILTQLIDHHTHVMGKTFQLLGIKEEMPEDMDWPWYIKHAHVYCLYDGDIIIGVCTCRTYKTGRRAKNTCYIMELIIEKEYRNQGLGRYLLNATVDDCKIHEPYINVVMLDVYGANKTSHQSYLNSGFIEFSHALYKPV